MDKLKEQVQDLTEDEWIDFLDWVVREEKDRREAAPAVSQGQAEIIRDLREQGTITDPAPEGEVAPWRDPGTDHSRMYLLGDRVSHGGQGVDLAGQRAQQLGARRARCLQQRLGG